MGRGGRSGRSLLERTTAWGSPLERGGNHLRNDPAFVLSLFFPKAPGPARTDSGLNVRSESQGRNVGKPQDMEKGGGGERRYTQLLLRVRVVSKPPEVGTVPEKSQAKKQGRGARPGAPQRDGQHTPYTQGHAREYKVLSEIVPLAHKGSFAESSERCESPWDLRRKGTTWGQGALPPHSPSRARFQTQGLLLSKRSVLP